jgi:hypothetical protein
MIEESNERGSVEQQYTPAESAALARTQQPGWFLSLIGLVNVLLGFNVCGQAIRTMRMTGDEFRHMLREVLSDDGLMLLDRWGANSQRVWVAGLFAWAAAALLAGVLQIYGGLNMRRLCYYGLALAGAVLAAIPVVSPLACFGIGEAVGIWALVILLQPDVRAAFC